MTDSENCFDNSGSFTFFRTIITVIYEFVWRLELL